MEIEELDSAWFASIPVKKDTTNKTQVDLASKYMPKFIAFALAVKEMPPKHYQDSIKSLIADLEKE